MNNNNQLSTPRPGRRAVRRTPNTPSSSRPRPPAMGITSFRSIRSNQLVTDYVNFHDKWETFTIQEFIERLKKIDNDITKLLTINDSNQIAFSIQTILTNKNRGSPLIKKFDSLKLNSRENKTDDTKKISEIIYIYKVINDTNEPLKFNNTQISELFIVLFNQIFNDLKKYLLHDLSRFDKIEKRNLQNLIKFQIFNSSEVRNKKTNVTSKYKNIKNRNSLLRVKLSNINKDINGFRHLYTKKELEDFKSEILKTLGSSVSRVYSNILNSPTFNLSKERINRLKREIDYYNRQNIDVTNIYKRLRNVYKNKSKDDTFKATKNKLFEALIDRIKSDNNTTLTQEEKNEFKDRPDLKVRLQTEINKMKKIKREKPFVIRNKIVTEQINEYKKSGKVKPDSYFKNRYGIEQKQLNEIKSKNYFANVKNVYANTNRLYYKKFIIIREQYWDDLKRHVMKTRQRDVRYTKTERDIKREYQDKIDNLNKNYGPRYASMMKRKILKHIRPMEKKIIYRLKLASRK